MGIAGRIDQQVAQDAVDFPWRAMIAPHAEQAIDLGERDFDFVYRVVARFVDPRRLAGRPDEHAGKQE